MRNYFNCLFRFVLDIEALLTKVIAGLSLK